MTIEADSDRQDRRLKKCPFCGKPGHIYKNDMSLYSDTNAIYYQPGCNTEDCICYHGVDCNFEHIEDAVKAWNKRAAST